MTRLETADFLRRYNGWRRGNLEDAPMQDPREVGKAIDDGIKALEEGGRLSDAVKELRGAVEQCLKKGSRWHACDAVVVEARRALKNTEGMT